MVARHFPVINTVSLSGAELSRTSLPELLDPRGEVLMKTFSAAATFITK
jgi:hypothetical protein